ncbi:hypothetical protein SBD_6204 [Streptomyces bottropensis ATCC 25435]|uniref:Uncharacterized protein n=1 Tax=Streptomyces bottropensis ATCC 25435 TaxID=1054862 RepID=M3EVH2_9ACTN|nr:hypothetical protein SBD_6204 [Streptomyces bottropensis ATCC 25435]
MTDGTNSAPAGAPRGGAGTTTNALRSAGKHPRESAGKHALSVGRTGASGGAGSKSTMKRNRTLGTEL